MVGGGVVAEGAGVGDVAGVVAAAELAGGGNQERAGVDRGRAVVGVVACEGECAGAVFGEAAGAGDDAGEGGIARRVGREGSCAEGDVARAGDRAEGFVEAAEVEGASGDIEIRGVGDAVGGSEGECAIVHGGRAGVGVGSRDRQRAGVVFGERTIAADDAGEGLVVGAIVKEGAGEAVDGDVAGVASPSETTGGADLQRAGADCSGESIGVVAVENERAVAGFDEDPGVVNAGKGAIDLSPCVVDLNSPKSVAGRGAKTSLNCEISRAG